MFKKFASATIAAALIATPVAANPATALSLSPDARAGTVVDGENTLTGLPLSTWISVAISLVAVYLAIDALSDDEPVSA